MAIACCPSILCSKKSTASPAIPISTRPRRAAPEQSENGIDLVDVFRASENVPPIVDDVIRLGIPYLWLQDGVIHDEAIARARAAGVKCIQNDCIYRRTR